MWTPQSLFLNVKNERRERLMLESKAVGRAAAKAKRNARIETGLPAYRTSLEVARDKPTSKRFAIYAKCYDCQGGPGADPGWQWAIGNCEILDSPLRPHQPYQHKMGQPPEGVYR